MEKKLYQSIAAAVLARENCLAHGNDEWNTRHKEHADKLASEFLPSGSGFDAGTKIDWTRTRPDRLVFLTSFHHMDENGMYDGWTEHSVIVTASLALEIDIRVTGRDRNDIKEYIAETFQYSLTQEGNTGTATLHGWAPVEAPRRAP